MQMWSLFSLLGLCFLDNHCQDPTTNVSPQKYVDVFAMAEALILTFMCMHVPSLRSLQAKVWFLRLIQSLRTARRMGSQGFCSEDKMPSITQKGSGCMQGNGKKKKKNNLSKKIGVVKNQTQVI